IVIVSSAAALPSATAVSIDNNATLLLDADVAAASLSGGAINPGTLALAGNTITIGNETDTGFYGVINGGGGGTLRKVGIGSLTLGGSASATALAVERGTLRLAAANSGLTGVVDVTGTGPT